MTYAASPPKKHDELASILEAVKDYCLANKIGNPTGTVEVGLDTTTCTFLCKDINWTDFVSLINSLGAKLIILETTVNELSEEDEELYTTHLTTYPEELHEELQSNLKKARRFKNCIAEFQLHFIHEGIVYTFHQEADWHAAYEEVISVLSTFELDDPSEDLNDPQEKFATEEEIEVVARQIASNEKYWKLTTIPERKMFAMTQIDRGQFKDWQDSIKIYQKAEEVFQAEVYPELEKKLYLAIAELKKKGVSKLGTKAKLKISIDALNRHWYDI